MFDSLLRPLKDRILAPAVASVGRRISPNAVTVLAFLAGLLCAAAICLQATIAAVVLWFLNRTLDGLDGAVARSTGRKTDGGGYLDIVLDFAVYAVLPLAMVFTVEDLPLARAGTVLLAAFYVNSASWMYLSAILERRKRSGSAPEGGSSTSVDMPAGLIEGTETIVLYTLMIALPALRYPLFLVSAGLTFTGAAVRFFSAFRMLSRGTRPPGE